MECKIIQYQRANLTQRLKSLKTHIAWKDQCIRQRRGTSLPFWNLLEAAEQDIRMEAARLYFQLDEFLKCLTHERLMGRLSTSERDALRREALILKREADGLLAAQHL